MVRAMSDAGLLYRNPIAYLNARMSYLQGNSRGTRPPGAISRETAFSPLTRCEFEIGGIGREDKESPAPPSDPRVWRQPFGDLLAGAYTYRVPVSYRITSTGASGVSLSMGTWTRDPDGEEPCFQRAEILRSLLGVQYPVVDTSGTHTFASQAGFASAVGGFVLGHPTAKAPVLGDNVLPVDRLIRALGNRPWRASILASPEAETVPEGLRAALIAELAFAEDAEKAAGHELPIAKQFTELVEPALRVLLDATTSGAWRTAVYLEADPATYPLLASVWRSVFSGERAAPETVNVFELEARQARQLASEWAFPLDAAESGPAEYRHPFEYQTLLSSGQLAAYVHLPSVEVPGFRIDVVPRFDVSTGGVDDPGPRVVLGTVVAHPAGNHDRGSPSIGTDRDGPIFSVSLPALSRHLFIAGVTGSGKTHTSLQLLRGLHGEGVPFLVIEPAKREYRELALASSAAPAAARLARELTVYTAASDEGTSLRINPFEVENGTTVAEHVDLLRAVFAASFGDMWSPLPQVLEQCMLRAYRDRGWDLVSDRNDRLAEGEDRSLAFPTLRELADTVNEIVDRLGFDPEARDRVRGSLATRINGLRVGSKGAMFDTREPLPMASLLGRPAILELERLADESDKAFLMGLLLIRLVEFRRGQRRGAKPGGAPGDALTHMLVIEEAHRLLANVSQGADGDNSARAQAVESFSNLLAEIRAYGQGIVVIDQVPTKLASDVIKNTNLKIAHRVVDEADRTVLGGSMSMSASQMAALASLARGEAAVFGGNDDAPVLVHMTGPFEVASAIDVVGAVRPGRSTRTAAHRGCVCIGNDDAAPECAAAGELAEQPEVRNAILRIATAALRARGSEELSSSELVEALRRDGAKRRREDLLIGCLAARGGEWLADVWGARGSWSFNRTLEFARALGALLAVALSTRADGRESGSVAEQLAAYQRIADALHRRTTDPYPSCAAICTGDLAGTCLYRHAVASTLRRPDVMSAWSDARSLDASGIDGYPTTWNTAVTTIASEILGPHVRSAARRAVALCFAQQALAAESPAWPPWSRVQFVDGLIANEAADPPRDGAAGRTEGAAPTSEVAS
jgi:hypothetical protein